MTLLALIAIILAVLGVVRIVQGDLAWGIVLLILACAIGPGGWAFYK